MMVSLQLPQLPHSEERRAFTRMLLRLPSLPAVKREKSRHDDVVTAADAPKSQRRAVKVMSLLLPSRRGQGRAVTVTL